VKIESDVCQPRNDPTKQIKDEVANVAKEVLHVIAKDPKKKHVAEKVQRAAMQEHAGEQWNDRSFQISAARKEMSVMRGDGAVDISQASLSPVSQRSLIKKDEDIRCDERVVHEGR